MHIVGAGTFDLWPEIGDRKPWIDRDSSPDHHVGDDRGGHRIEVEQWQRRPGDGVFVTIGDHQHLPRQAAGIVVADHAALRRTSGAAGVDQHCEVMGQDLHVRLAGVVAEQIAPCQHGLLNANGRNFAAINQRGQLRQLAGNGRDPIGVIAFGNDYGGCGITDLMAQEITFQRCVDRYAHGAELIDGEPDEDSVGGVIQQRHNRLAFLYPQLAQAIGQAAGGLVDVGESVGAIEKIHELAVTIFLGSAL